MTGASPADALARSARTQPLGPCPPRLRPLVRARTDRLALDAAPRCPGCTYRSVRDLLPDVYGVCGRRSGRGHGRRVDQVHPHRPGLCRRLRRHGCGPVPSHGLRRHRHPGSTPGVRRDLQDVCRQVRRPRREPRCTSTAGSAPKRAADASRRATHFWRAWADDSRGQTAKDAGRRIRVPRPDACAPLLAPPAPRSHPRPPWLSCAAPAADAGCRVLPRVRQRILPSPSVPGPGAGGTPGPAGRSVSGRGRRRARSASSPPPCR